MLKGPENPDLIYFGGGYPELYAKELSSATRSRALTLKVRFKTQVRNLFLSFLFPAPGVKPPVGFWGIGLIGAIIWFLAGIETKNLDLDFQVKKA